jgi:hypothetical protein
MVLGQISVTEAQFLGMLIHYLSFHFGMLYAIAFELQCSHQKGSNFWFEKVVDISYLNVTVSRGTCIGVECVLCLVCSMFSVFYV